MKKYKVVRPHQGDKWYPANSDREADPLEVAHLVAAGVLIDPDAAAEADDDGQQDAGSEGGDDGQQGDNNDTSDAKDKPAQKVENKAVKAASVKKSD